MQRKKTAFLTALLAALWIISVCDCQAGVQGSIIGRVVDSEGEPIKGVKITMVNVKNRTVMFELKTNRKGVFQKVGLDPVVWETTMEKEDYVTMKMPVKITPGRKLEHTFEMLTIEEAREMTPLTPEEQAVQDFNAGADKYNAGDFEGAKELLESAIKNNPELKQAYFLLGNIAYQEQNHEKTIEHMSKAIELDGEYTQAYLIRGATYNSTKKYEEAIEDWKKYLELAGDEADATVPFNVAALCANTGKLEEAIKYFKMATEMKENYGDAYRQLGYISLRLKNNAEAKKYFQKYLEAAPNASDKDKVKGLMEYL